MQKIIFLILLCATLNFSQSNFWSYHSLNGNIIQLEMTADGTFYAVTDSSVIKSMDFGNNWDTILVKPNGSRIFYIQLFCGKSLSSSNALAVLASQPTSKYFGYSINGGDSWSGYNYSGFMGDLIIDNEGNLFKYSDTLYKSNDGGFSWEYITTPTSLHLGSNLEIDEENNLYLDRRSYSSWYEPPYWVYSWEYRFFTSSNEGQTWDSLCYFNEGDIDSGQDRIEKFFVTLNGDLFLSVCDRGLSDVWYMLRFKNGTKIRDNSFDHITDAIMDGNILEYVSSYTDGIRYSSNDGNSWEEKNSGLPSLSIKSLVRDSLGYLYVATSNGIYKSNFTSFSFSPLTNYQFEDTRLGDTTYKEIKLTNPFPFNITIDSLKCSSLNFFIPNFNSITLQSNDSSSIDIGFMPDSMGSFNNYISLYAGSIVSRITLTGLSSRPTLLVLPFTNFGNVVIGDTVTSKMILTSRSVNEIIVDTIYMHTNDEFFIDALLFPIEMNNNDTISFNIHFAPTTQNILNKRDTVVIRSNCTNSEIFRVVNGRGINPTSVEEKNLIITEFNLSNNFPNPFNPLTTIEYQVPKTSSVKIRVYNLVGEEIATLVDEEKTCGKYQIEFNASNLPSGVYFYKMQAEDFTVTKKFILLK
jgi:hypothetical protein